MDLQQQNPSWMSFGWDIKLAAPYTSVYAGQVKDPTHGGKCVTCCALSNHLINHISIAARACLRGLHFPYHTMPYHRALDRLITRAYKFVSFHKLYSKNWSPNTNSLQLSNSDIFWKLNTKSDNFYFFTYTWNRPINQKVLRDHFWIKWNAYEI